MRTRKTNRHQAKQATSTALVVVPQTKRELHVSAEVHLDPRNPIPFEYGGFGLASGTGFYLPFLDSKDNFFNKLLELRTLSVTHNACVTTKTDYVIGGGLKVTNLKEGQEEDEKFVTFRNNANGRQKGLNKILRRICDNFLTFGNGPVEIVRGQVAGTRFIYIHAHNQLECRLERPKGSAAEQMVYSPAFRRSGMISDPGAARFIPLWRRTTIGKVWRVDESVERTALWVKNEMAGYEHYGMPSSVSSIHDQKIEHDAVRFNLDNLENNMVPGGMVVLEGSFTQEEANKIGRKIINQNTGAGKRGRITVVSSEQGIKNSKFLSFDTQKEGSYDKLDDKAREKILLANQWDATLAGLSDKSTLGNGTGYLQEIYDQKMATVIMPLQRMLLDEVVAPLLEICDEWLGTKWSDYKLDFEPLPIINRKTSELATSVEGMRIVLEISKAIKEGFYTHEAAVKLLAGRFGLTEQEASDILPTNQPSGSNV